MDFSDALKDIKAGRKVARSGWNGKNMWIHLHGQNAGWATLDLPYVEMWTADGHFVPWLCSQTDMLAEDWETVG